MYGYIRGVVVEIDSNYIVLDNNGIGYLIYVPNPYSYQLNNEYTVFTYTKVAEDEYTLYGFKTREQKELFLKLISVKGLGAKMALPIIATGTFEAIADAIENNNLNYLKKFPKIGDKVAKDEAIAYIHANSIESAEEAISKVKNAYTIIDKKVKKPSVILEIL